MPQRHRLAQHAPRLFVETDDDYIVRERARPAFRQHLKLRIEQLLVERLDTREVARNRGQQQDRDDHSATHQSTTLEVTR